MKNDIDFVLLWVDGSDKEWLKEKRKYSSSYGEDDNENRYRDWENLKYWFRGVETFAPWVNKIHLVTCGHYPKWLNLNHPKLNLVSHHEIIDNNFLPTFNSQAIEVNIHKIKGLSDKFVYFNDDFFIIDKVKKTDFFKNNLPCDSCILDVISTKGTLDPYDRVLLNNIDIINKYFDKKESIKNNFNKYFCPIKYGKEIIKTILLYPWPKFTNFKNSHGPNSFLKQTFNEVWDKEKDILINTCSSKFRSDRDLNQYIFKNWQLASGTFIPRKYKFNAYYEIGKDSEKIHNSIIKQSYKIISINDVDLNINFEQEKDTLNRSFETILPNKSSFEI